MTSTQIDAYRTLCVDGINELCDLAALAAGKQEPVQWPDNRCPQCGTVHPLLAHPPAGLPEGWKAGFRALIDAAWSVKCDYVDRWGETKATTDLHNAVANGNALLTAAPTQEAKP